MTTNLETVETAKLEPAAVWRIFAGIADVPRPSKHEERIRAHVKAFAASQGLSVREEQIGNLIIDVPASPGCENAPITVLQAHLDMVCEKNSGTEHDFDKEGIRFVMGNGNGGGRVLRADGTTLGADNGVGVAMALAAATSKDVKHGPLELLFTIDEEAGMSGAKALKPESFKGRRLINLDSEEDNAIYIGCAGGCDTNLNWMIPLSPVDLNSDICRLTVSGLRGGHSGGDIHENRGCANKLLVHTLLTCSIDGVRIHSIDGGSKRNAISREASAVVAGPLGLLVALNQAASRMTEVAKEQSNEPKASIVVEAESGGEVPLFLSEEESARLLLALSALPHGVLGMHPTVPGLVQTSNNLSTIASDVLDDGQRLHIEVGTLSRSSSDSWMRTTCEQIASIGQLAGADVSSANEYPGWDPNPDSAILKTTSRIYESLFGEPAHVAAIHAGLECGIIGQRVGEMDMVSFGPTITGAHSPDEQIYVESVAKSWKLLVAVLDELSKS